MKASKNKIKTECLGKGACMIDNESNTSSLGILLLVIYFLLMFNVKELNSVFVNESSDSGLPVSITEQAIAHDAQVDDSGLTGSNGTFGIVGLTEENSAGNSKKLVFEEAGVFPPEVVQLLPDLLKRIVLTGETDVEQSLVLLSAIVSLSGLMPNVALFYGHIHSPHLYCMIIANAAAGKSKVNQTVKILDKVHLKLVNQCNAAKQEYKSSLKSNCETCPDPVKPDCNGLYIAEDCTHASLIDKLSSKQKYNLLFSTETDSLTRALTNEQFDKTDLWRKAFHHEPISQSRRHDEREIYIPNPALAMLVTGTPSTVAALVKSHEDGTASRFIYFGFGSYELEWKSQQSEAKQQAIEEIEKISDDVLKLFESIKDRFIQFDFTDLQKNELDEFFSDITNSLDPEHDQYFFASVKRFGLIFKRMAAVISIIKAYEDGSTENTVICSDDTFKACKLMVNVLLEHSKVIFSSLENRTYVPITNPADKLFQKLPESFTPVQGYEIGMDKFGYSDRVVRKHYKNLIETGKLEKFGRNYKKVVHSICSDSATQLDSDNKILFNFKNS